MASANLIWILIKEIRSSYYRKSLISFTVLRRLIFGWVFFLLNPISPAYGTLCRCLWQSQVPNPRDLYFALPSLLRWLALCQLESLRLLSNTCLLALSWALAVQSWVLSTLFRPLWIQCVQIVGDQKHGIWNEKEMIPMIVRSRLRIGTLPVFSPSVHRSWNVSRRATYADA